MYMVDEATGGLEVSHRLILSDRDYGGSPGSVGQYLLYTTIIFLADDFYKLSEIQ